VTPSTQVLQGGEVMVTFPWIIHTCLTLGHLLCDPCLYLLWYIHTIPHILIQCLYFAEECHTFNLHEMLSSILEDDHCYRGIDKSLAQTTSQCSLFDGDNISFYDSLVIYINSTNISPIMIINRIYETQILLSL
jgi:hypothetical protein